MALVALLAGCGSGPKTIPVQGKVTFGGKHCPAAGKIYFLPVSSPSGTPGRPGQALFDKDGQFRADSLKLGDGLLPGTYHVRIECWKKIPSESAKGESYIPNNYNPPDVVVDPGAGGSVTVNFNIPK
jgi:hypothetical protein